MRSFPTLKDYAAEEGNEIGVSDWMVVDQERINMFAEATGHKLLRQETEGDVFLYVIEKVATDKSM